MNSEETDVARRAPLSRSDYTETAANDWKRIHDNTGQLPLEITMRLRRAAMRFEAVITSVINATALANYGEYEVLSALRRAARRLTPGDLADELLVTKAGMTGRLNRLEQEGLIDRVPNTADARSAWIELTTRGTATVDDVFQQLVDAQEAILADLSIRQREQLALLLKQLLLTLGDVPAGGR